MTRVLPATTRVDGYPDDFKFAHHSSRFSRSPRTLARAIRLLIRDDHALITFTEVSNPRRARAAKRMCAAAGWGFIRQGRFGECAIAYDKRVFAEVHREQVDSLSRVSTYSTKGRKRPPVKALAAVLAHTGSGRTYLVSAIHTTSHVATKAGWRSRRSGRVRQYLDAGPRWSRQLASWSRAWRPTGGVIAAADWNIDLAQPFARRWVAASFPFLTLVRDHRFADTMDTRTLDGVLVSKGLIKKGRIRIYPMRAASDHKTISMRLVRN